MNFFEHQDAARRQTRRLLLLVAVGLFALIATFYGCAIYVVHLHQRYAPVNIAFNRRPPTNWLDLRLFAGVAAATSIAVGSASLYKLHQLSGGGRVIAELAGGRAIDSSAAESAERRFVNVAEEMAIAAGLPVPALYVLEDEKGINAFAAGLTPNDAAVAVTRGALEQLSRDELQGVVAHEYSHILNGDMRLNARLIGLVYGILVLHLIGRGLLRAIARGSMRSSGRKSSGGIVVSTALVGATLAVVGGAGLIVGRMIKAAINRQREFLADAAAVQFTRHPAGLAGALEKIAGDRHTRLASPAAEEIAHLLFASGVSGWWGRLFATHPPIGERLRRLAVPPAQIQSWEEASAEAEPPQAEPTPRERIDPRAFVAQIGTLPLIEPRRQAKRAANPLLDATKNPPDAAGLVLRMLLSDDPAVRATQIDRLVAEIDPAISHALVGLERHAAAFEDRHRLELIDRALPALRQLSKRQAEALLATAERLMLADHRVTLFEFAVAAVLKRRLGPTIGRVAPPRLRYTRFAQIREATVVLISALSRAEVDDDASAAEAFAAAMRQFPGSADVRLAGPIDLRQVRGALDRLAEASAELKASVVAAAADCVLADRTVTPREAALLRAVCESLDLPVPPTAGA